MAAISRPSDDAWRWRIEEAIAGPISREVWGNAELSKADQGGAEVRPPARMLSWKASRRATVSSRKTTGGTSGLLGLDIPSTGRLRLS